MPVAKSRLECVQICKLLQCVNERNYQQIEKLVASGVPHIINYNDPNSGDTPLGAAAAENDEEMISFLLESVGAHPDVVDFQGRTALMRAAEYGHVQSFELLSKKGADLKIADTKGRGVLFCCISPTERHAKCMELALQYNADVNSAAKDGRTAFFAACETAKDNEDACIALLEKGADPDIVHNVTGRTALMMAAGSGSVRVVRATLQRGADPNAVDKFGRTAAHEAAKGGHFEVIVCLSAYGAFFDVYDNKGNNPIHMAAGSDGNCCRYLAQRGCNPKQKNNEGELPKVIAKDKGKKDCMKELRKAEKTFGRVGKNNEPWAILLYDWATDRKDELLEIFQKFDPDESGVIPKEDLIDTLKNMDAPLEDEAEKKIFPLFDKNKDGKLDYKDFIVAKKYVNKNYMLASYEGKKKKKKKGGRGGGRKKKGKLPMDICIQPSEEIMRPIDGGPPISYIPRHFNFTDNDRFSADKPPWNPLQDDSVWYLNQPEKQYISMNDAAKHGDLDSIRNALQRGYKIDTRDKYYKTPLMVACHYGNLDVAKALIELGADVNAKDNFHWTPLHHASHSGMIDVVELLIHNDAIIDSHAMNGATPLYRAVEASRLNVVEYLISRGAKVMLENRKGANPVDVAESWSDPRVYDIVRAKYDSLPPPGDKKKGGRPKTAPGSAKSKTGGRGGSAKADQAPPKPATPPEEQFHARRKASILRAASALARGIDDEEEVVFCPKRPWIPQPSTDDLLLRRQEKRDRFGWEVDFPESFAMPFHKNIADKIIAMGDE